MPELPEVETTRRGLLDSMNGKRIEEAVQNRPDLRWPFPQNFAKRLTGSTIISMRRRAKYMLFDLDQPSDTPETLIVHLGMSGRMIIMDRVVGTYTHSTDANPKHDHMLFHMSEGRTITFNDPRRFGAMDLWPTHDLENHKFFHGMGPEPLSNEFNEDHLLKVFKGRKTPMKSALLNQKFIAGLGNIYVCEALHMARISPDRAAGEITKAEATELTHAIRKILIEAIEAGGSSLKDYRQADGALGYFQHQFRTYDQQGKPCQNTNCNGEIARKTHSGRSTFFCNTCQI